MRWKLTLQYDGEAFYGWQSQKDVPTVQDALEKALASLCQQPIRAIVAGRTDKGVHALGQVVHIDIQRSLTPERLRLAIQAHLQNQPISIISAEPVSDDFHARFSARVRHYEYHIIQTPHPPILSQKYGTWSPKSLNIEAMEEGAQYLLGHHDFTSFRASGCQASSPLRSLDSITWQCSHFLGEKRIIGKFSARSFLYHQVRNMVGTLMNVGLGRNTPKDVATILAAKDRKQAGKTAPAQGLYFLKVDYDQS